MKIFLILVLVIALELIAMFTVKKLRRKFQWLITPEDELPELDREGLEKFIKHGFDPELGWVRKSNTWHPERGRYGETTYHIGSDGARCHPGREGLQAKISCYGDSFTFSRQVNDDETWPYYLSMVSGAGVLNFGVGNYGLDQAYLRMLRETKKIRSDIVIMGVVPSTIVRILCVWKHYNEFGNTFGFKPRFDLKDGELVLTKNIIDEESKFLKYRDFLKEIRDNDYFYRTKFRDEMIKFPYFWSVLRKGKRNLPLISALLLLDLLRLLGIRSERLEGYPLMKIMEINKAFRYRLFKNRYATDIMEMIVDRFVESAKEQGSKPVFLLMPQKDDVLFVRKKGPYYKDFINRISEKVLTIDMTDYLLDRCDLDTLYSDDNVYGGHFSKHGNKFLAETIHRVLKENAYL